MLPRFLLPSLQPDQSEAALPPEEAHHLTRVLRLGVGDEVVVFNGRGLECRARVLTAERGAASVLLLERIAHPAGPSVALTLAQAVLKGDGMDDVIRDATMVGVEVIQPIVSARTTVKAAVVSRAAERWRRIALASSKQCGRSRLPEVEEAMPFEDWIRRPQAGLALLLVEPSAALPATLTIRQLSRQPPPGRACLIVGPEGGWTSEERDLAMQHGCTPLSLGPLTLRADAVALAAAAALIGIWDDTAV